MKQKYNVGIIGAGNISQLHISAYKKIPNVNVRSIADTNKNNLITTSKKWEIENVYDDYKKILNDPKIDIVEILTPHYLHSEMFIEAIDQKKHVSVQKPMAISNEECMSMINKSKSNKEIKSRIFDNFLYYPPYLKAKELISRGEIGEIRSIRLKSIIGEPNDKSNSLKLGLKDAGKNWRFDETLSGGGKILFDYGYHIFSIAYDLLGDIKKISSFVDETVLEAGSKIDCPGIIMWDYGNGKHGSWDIVRSNEIDINSDFFNEDEWYEITGTKGFIWVNRCSGNVLDTPALIIFNNGKSSKKKFSSNDLNWSSSFDYGIRNFVDSIENNFDSKLSPKEGKKVFDFCKSAKESSESGLSIVL